MKATLKNIHKAQRAGADLIELDIHIENGQIHVSHCNTCSKGALLEDVLDDPSLQQGDQILFIEIKEYAVTEAFIRQLLDIFVARKSYYARNGRPVVFRTFSGREANLIWLNRLLSQDRYQLIHRYIRLSILFDWDSSFKLKTYLEYIKKAHQKGYSMVELHYRSPELFPQIALARKLGLGLNIWTLPYTDGKAFISGFQELSDVLTTDYLLDKSYQSIRNADTLFYVNPADPSSSKHPPTRSSQIARRGLVKQYVHSSPMASEAPLPTTTLHTTSVIHPGIPRTLRIHPEQGILLHTALTFKSLSIQKGQSAPILSQTGTLAWALSLHRPRQSKKTFLRFHVRVGTLQQSVSHPVTKWVVGKSYMLMALFNGKRKLTLWLNSRKVGRTSYRFQHNTQATTQAAFSRIVPLNGIIEMSVAKTWHQRK